MLEYDKTPDSKKSKVAYLDNFLGIKDVDKAMEVDLKISLLRATELLEKNELASKPLNMETLCFIHKKLFGDLYPWAGKIRDVNLSKGYNTYYYIENLPNGIKEVFSNLKKDNYLKNLTLEEFIELFSYYDTELFIVHPFREGNGRSRRIFMKELAKRAGYTIDYNKFSPTDLRRAEEEAFGDGAIYNGPNMLNLKIMFSKIIKPIDSLKISVPKMQTVEQIINRHLWVYDREEYNKWMNDKTYLQGEKMIKELLKTEKGVETICKMLERSKGGAKTTTVRSRADRYIKALSKIYKKNNQNEQCKE